ncbi:MAG TPA: metallophosphoesterase [Bacteroidales bacterium]|nr:metallophosphoesterase [Bacteroidales bacterium]HQI69807.1 metallophosphoesterase [Bacteroidales bacterium]
MKNRTMWIFFTIVFLIHFLVNFYIFIRGWQSLSLFPSVRPYFTALFIFLFLSYILARVLEKYIGFSVANVFNRIGSMWLAAMLYFFLIILFIDLLRMFNQWLHFFPAIIMANYAKTKFITMIFTVCAVLLLITYGFINANIVRITTMSMRVNKQAGNLSSLNIVMLSDIHLGTIIGQKKLGAIISKVNDLSPDIVLLAGDVVDENVRHVIIQNLGAEFEKIKSKYGVYAVPGNHEFIGGADAAVAYLEKHQVLFLRDTAVLIDNSFWVAGRNDKDMSRFNGKTRKTLETIMVGVDKNFPVILMDHQPFSLEKSAENGVDVQFSGHTHHGQIYPLNLITRGIYHPDWGYRKIGDTHFYVSCGVGTWGPPVRIGNYPEIVNAKIIFN